MELEIFVSKKGTKVVAATNLHAVLQLPKAQYSRNVRRWQREVYEFHDGIRQPEVLKDYAQRHVEGLGAEDFYLTVELAKLITLNSASKFKRKFANHLLSLDDQVANAELLSKDQVIAVLELAKAMGLISCQVASEQQHLQRYKAEHGSPANWWAHRSKVLGYSPDDTRNEQQAASGASAKAKSQRELLFKVDKYETIRAAVIDLFLALGKPETYARNLGDLAKEFARELRVELWDDRDVSLNFPTGVNMNLVQEIKNNQAGQYLGAW
jgi:phage anti-repressor protein